MPDLSDTIARLGADQLADLLGKDTIKIIEALNDGNVTAYRLSQILLRQLGADGILQNKSFRNELFLSLPDSHARILAQQLGLPASGNPWKALTTCRFESRSDRLRKLYHFFNCTLTEDEQTDDTTATVTLSPEYPLFEHQIDACRNAIAILESNTPRVLLHMPTGAGKTRTAMNLIAHFARQRLKPDEIVVWLAHSEELCDQAVEEFTKAWANLGIRQLSLHRCFGQTATPLETVQSGFLVGGLQMMFSRSGSQQSEFLRVARKTRLVVMDEAHQAVAPTYRHILNLLMVSPDTAFLGLSATPGRATINAFEDMKLADFFNKQKVSLRVSGYDSPITYLQQEGYIANVRYERIPYARKQSARITSAEAATIQKGLGIPISLLEKIGNDEQRNLLLINRILQLCEDEHRKIIVFACSVAHAQMIANVLIVRGINAAAVTSHTPASQRESIIRAYKSGDDPRVLTNFGVLTTGFDAPCTNTAVIARPTDSVVLFSQMVGRAARGVRAGGSSVCDVVTIVDDLPGFRSVAESFEYWNEIWE